MKSLRESHPSLPCVEKNKLRIQEINYVVDKT
jgi:hypothetical protein